MSSLLNVDIQKIPLRSQKSRALSTLCSEAHHGWIFVPKDC